ncbi:TPA: hypothetical protein ACG4OH_001071 [Stenotrophomonas maltophilia]|uniref:hypothetical protein n=1 Tax=Stenotrophomonas maltophilia TaxID=40324 RepID=UPI001F2E41DE|nr:hypothetical protein [Stenotrophomonas maltophilia]UKJ26336.1 hypothetical protein L6173_03100 [Stenotrophomonas maltophilia]
MATTSEKVETFFIAAFVTRMHSAGFPRAGIIVAQSFRIRMLPALLALGMVVSPGAFADGDDPAAVRAITSAQALQDLAAVIECRAPTSVREPLSRNVWDVVLGDGKRAKPPFDAWIVVKQPNSYLHEVELPSPITVFGYPTQRIAVLSDGTMAILDDVSFETISKQLEMNPLHATAAPHIHVRNLSLRNVSEIGFSVRSLTASRVSTHPDSVLVGCEERYDTRMEQLRRRGKEPDVVFAPGVDIATELDDVLSCNADALRNYTADWAVTMSAHTTDTRFKGWKDGEDEEGNRWWVPPAPIMIAGRPVSRLVKVGQTLYAELDGDIAETLAEEWLLPPYDGWSDAAFVGFYDTGTAADGWLEDRARIVRAWAPGKTLHGCEYQQNRPEFGEHPDDDDEG